MPPYVPTASDPPYLRLGEEPAVKALVEAFYDAMETHEPELARLHALDHQGRITRHTRDRFGLFLSEWLGGPKRYSELAGHPRLRMRHAAVPIDTAMRDAWLRAMGRAFDQCQTPAEVRSYLESKLADLAEFLRNRPF